MITEEQARLAANRICGNRYGESETDFLRWASDIQACATWITEELARRDADRIERDKPITREWLKSIGSVRIPDDVYPDSDGNDNEQIGKVILWEFNDTGRWLVRDADWMGFTTRGQLLDLLAALKGGAQ